MDSRVAAAADGRGTMGRAAFGLLVSLVLCLTADESEAERSGWNVNPETQYHIQTDEGPERYFRFQTLNGQYRKERRLEDGTVIGTEGWLDPLGYLRIKDYIADTKGYRILKSKMIYMGKDRPIQDAVALSKKVPASSGVLSRPVRPPNPFRRPELKDVVSNSIDVRANLEPIRTSYASSSTPAPQRLPHSTPSSFRLRPIVMTTMRPRPFSLAGAYDGSRASDYSRPGSNYLVASYNKPYRGSYRSRQQQQQQQPAFLEQDQNQLASNSAARVVPGAFRGYQRWNGTISNGSGSRLPSRRPTTTSYRSPAASSNAYKEYEFPAYDGTHGTGDGFQYYLKKQYHEEERQRPDKSVGSFGYVDPFGIRRVVYYAADGRNGFVHRKNNRYVGHDAKPYDPVPIAAEQAVQ